MDQSSFRSISSVVSVIFFFIIHSILLSQMYVPHLQQSAGAQDLYPGFEMGLVAPHPI